MCCVDARKGRFIDRYAVQTSDRRVLLRDKADFGGLAAPLPRFVLFFEIWCEFQKTSQKGSQSAEYTK